MADTNTTSEQQVSSATRVPGPLTILALLLAALALAVALWAGWQFTSLRALPDQVSNDVVRMQELTRRVDRLAEDTLEQREEALQLRTALEGRLNALADIPVRLEQLEQQVAAIPGISQQTRTEWLKTEALYYLRIANAQALLAGDSEIAASALRLADDKLRQAGDPAMAAVRARLADEIAALDAMPQIDRSGISFRLQSLTGRANSWPLRAAAPDSFAPEAREIDAGLTAWQRFVATLQNVFFSIVSVKETEAVPVAQIGAAEQALIVEGIKAELQVARLAFATGNGDLFSGSLARAASQIRTYFDTSAASVQSALATLDEIQSTDMPTGLPDISGSLALMLETRNDGVPAAAQEPLQ